LLGNLAKGSGGLGRGDDAHDAMIATPDSFRDTLEELDKGRGVTDPVAGPVVVLLE
jgi:hypothetical protein